jgi:hypothetical protein
MPGRFLPPDHSQGDANTIGGYTRVHQRPAAFEGSDGYSYSVEIDVDAIEETARPFAAYFLFLRWRRLGRQGVEGHLESEYLAYGGTPAEARDSLGRWQLADVRRVLEQRIRETSAEASTRRWWDAMRDDDP